MKIGGVTPTRATEVLVLPRPDGNDLVFKAQAVLSMDEFETACPRPKAPVKVTSRGEEVDTTAKAFLEAVNVWATRRHAFICVKSLEPSNIEWDTVKLDSPSTWGNWVSDLEAGGLCSVEIQRVQQCVIDANALNEEKLKAARESFLRGQVLAL